MTPTAMAAMTGNAIREALEPGTRWKHKKRGSTYEIVGLGKMQAENWRDLTRDGVLLDGEEIGDPVDMREVAVYRPLPDGPIWVRPVSEFLDGRFEPLPRTAYDAIGSGVVEEADAKENLFLIRKRGAYYRPNEQGYTSSIAEAGRYSREDAERITHPNGPDGPRDGMDYVPAPALLSTHTAAGAGPVGEAVAWRVRRFGNVAWFLTFAPDNYSAKTHEKEPLYARPVEEPGEVERDSDEESYQIGKRDGYEEAVQHIDERTGGDGEYVAVVGGDPEKRNCPDAPSMVAKIVARFEAAVEEISRQTVARGEKGLRAETAEAALAETRERLEKETQRIDQMFERFLEKYHACDAPVSTDDVADYLSDVRRAVAALTGDAQESGR